MIKTFKWIYKLGYNNARHEVFSLLEKERAFHLHQSQIKTLSECKAKGLSTRGSYLRESKVTGNDHDQRLKEVEEILNQLDPKRYPNIDNFLDMLQ